MERTKPFEVGDLVCSDTRDILGSDGRKSLALILKVTYSRCPNNHTWDTWAYDVYSFDNGQVYIHGWREDADELKQHFLLVARCEK